MSPLPAGINLPGIKVDCKGNQIERLANLTDGLLNPTHLWGYIDLLTNLDIISWKTE